MKFQVGMVVMVTANFKAPDLIGLGVILEARENEPQKDGDVRNVYRVRVHDVNCWIRESHLSDLPKMECSLCGGPVPCTLD